MSDRIIVGTPEWHEARRTRIGGSEQGALWGVRYGITAWQLFQMKTGLLAHPDIGGKERVMAGTFLESGIAAWATATWPEMGPIERCLEYVPHPTIPGIGASLDFRRCEDGAPVEIKNVDFLIWRDNWVCEGDTIIEAPLHIELQVQHELACTKASYAWLVICVGGNTLYRCKREARPATIGIIEAKVAEFWDRVARNDPPPPDFEHDGAAIATLYREGCVYGKQIDLTKDNRMPELVAMLERARANSAASAKVAEECKAEILNKLSDAESAIIAGGDIVTAKLTHKEAHMVKESTFPVIRIMKAKF